MSASVWTGECPVSDRPLSCDTFAVLPPSSNGCIIFGKNSDRPSEEVQEVVYFAAADHSDSTKLKCTYIEIDQVDHTYAVILSKPSWMWGAEMGANEHGVCIGNEAVWTRAKGPSDSIERLLGMDLLRLGLERSSTAFEAVKVITDLLEKYGQGGNCSETIPDFTYQNSFLIADPTEVWILETAKNHWAAEHIKEGTRNISNDLTIGSKIDLMSPGLVQQAEKDGLYRPKDGPFSFTSAFGYGDENELEDRYAKGKYLLKTYSPNFKETDMFKILRDKPSGICMSFGSFVSTGSQVSVLRPKDSGMPCVHWFTATPDPSRSVYKPFIFNEDVKFPDTVISPVSPNADSDRSHTLWQLHGENMNPFKVKDQSIFRRKMKELESTLLEKVEQLSSNFDTHKSEVGNLFKDAVQEEMKMYEK